MGWPEQLPLFPDTPASTSALQPAPQPRAEHAVATACPPALPHNARWREVRAAQQTIGYVLQRSRRKSIGLTINDDGLQVTAPNWVTLGQIDATVVEKAPWILGKLRIRQARQQHAA
ncbi:MAG: M48 family metallopeptidase, partial [Pollutimonas bauzanensis]